jgi:predicted ATPase/class 3 adenylate cyclase
MPERPAGTVTFLFTDVEESTRLLQAYEQEYPAILVDQRRIVREAVEQYHGQVVDAHGDSVFVVFPRAKDALASAIAAQRALRAHPWPGGQDVRIRMGLHTGEPVSTEGGYVGMDVHRAARICAAGFGGQVILSEATRSLIEDDLPGGATLVDLGEHRLKDLIHPLRLYQVVAAGLLSQFPPLRSLATLPNNLPVQLTSFVGREREMAEVKRLFGSTRLLTLTGPGGCGKTRLALQVAADVLEDYPDGVWLVELAALSDAALIPQTIATSLGIREQAGRAVVATVADYLQSKDLLLVLDNCEHLVAGCAEVIETLLRSCPTLHLLTTSREPVGVAGEMIWSVPPLTPPSVNRGRDLAAVRESEAVRLFTERAQGVARKFALTPENAGHVAQICLRLDGFPLAIELAAARVKVLSVEEIAARLDDRFRLLTGGSRTALPRHQTLRATMDWSHDLLSPAERVLFRRLSVFAGGFTLPVGEAVCAGEGIDRAEVLDLLTRLVDRSLVAADLRGEAARYRLLETVRQYALGKLLESGEAPITRARHRDWFMARTEEAEAEMHGPQQRTWFDLLEVEHDNLRAAMEWSRSESAGAQQALRLAGNLWWFWFVRGYLTEGREQLETALASDDVRSAPRARALVGAGSLAAVQGDYRHGVPLAEEGVRILRELGDDRNLAFALVVVGFIARQQGEHERAAMLCTDGVALARQVGLGWVLGLGLYLLGEVALFRGDHQRARTILEESLAVYRQEGDIRGIALAQLGRALVARQQGDYDLGAQLCRDSLAIFLELNDTWGLAQAMRTQALVVHAGGDYARAEDAYSQSLTLYRQLGDRWGAASSMRSLALMAHRRGDLDRARQLCEESLSMFRDLGDRRGTADTVQTLGVVARAQGDYAAASAAWQESLDLFWGAGDRLGTVQCLRLLAELAVMQGAYPRAAHLFGAVEGVSAAFALEPARHAPARYETALREVEERMPTNEFSAGFNSGRAMTMDEAVAFALQRGS